MCDEKNSRKRESRLIKRLQGGDLTAFDEIFAEYRQRIFAYVLGFLHDRGNAEDVTQECFVTLARKIESISPSKGLLSWLFRVARNRSIDRLRKRTDLLPGDDFVEDVLHEDTSQAVPDTELLRKEESRRIRKLLDSLPKRERDVIAMRFFGDLKFREIAKVMKRPLGTVLWQANTGMKRLRDRLKDEQMK